MQSARAPKQWALKEGCSINEFETWRQNLLYVISMDTRFDKFMETAWLAKSAAEPHHGLEDDDEDAIGGQTAAQKNKDLELMLGQIANFCTIIARDDFVKRSTSLADVWHRIRLHLGFQRTGAQFLDLGQIKLEHDERPEALYQRLNAFFQDNLITAEGELTHHGARLMVDEDMSPSLENTVVFMWLNCIHPGLPALVKQKYGAELRSRTLASMKPEISIALSSLLEELKNVEEVKAYRTAQDASVFRSFAGNSGRNKTQRQPQRPQKSCTLCKASGRKDANNHWLRDCPFLTEGDRRQFARTRLTNDIEFDNQEPDENQLEEEDDPLLDSQAPTRRVEIVASPVLACFYGRHAIKLTLDCSATTNIVQEATALRLNLPILPATQGARQADGSTPLNTVGETHILLSRGKWRFTLDALVVRKLDVEVLAGMPFMMYNDIATRPARKTIVIQGVETVRYDDSSSGRPVARLTSIIRSPNAEVVLPGEYVELPTPSDLTPDSELLVEPRYDNGKLVTDWLKPQVTESVGNKIRLTNTSQCPVSIPKHSHVCQVRQIASVQKIIPDTITTSGKTPISEPSQNPDQHA